MGGDYEGQANNVVKSPPLPHLTDECNNVYLANCLVFYVDVKNEYANLMNYLQILIRLILNIFYISKIYILCIST